MDHNRSNEIVLSVLGRRSVLKLESFWQVKVELCDCQRYISFHGLKNIPGW